MQLISTDYRDYLPGDELRPRNPKRPTIRPLVDSAARVVSYVMISLGLTLLAYGLGFGSGAIVGVLLGYPVAQTLGMARGRAHTIRANR